MRLCSPFTILLWVLDRASGTVLLRKPDVDNDSGPHADLLEPFPTKSGQTTGTRLANDLLAGHGRIVSGA